MLCTRGWSSAAKNRFLPILRRASDRPRPRAAHGTSSEHVHPHPICTFTRDTPLPSRVHAGAARVRPPNVDFFRPSPMSRTPRQHDPPLRIAWLHAPSRRTSHRSTAQTPSTRPGRAVSCHTAAHYVQIFPPSPYIALWSRCYLLFATPTYPNVSLTSIKDHPDQRIQILHGW